MKQQTTAEKVYLLIGIIISSLLILIMVSLFESILVAIVICFLYIKRIKSLSQFICYLVKII